MLTPTQSVQLNALNADALKYLGGQVGKIIEAKVISVSEVLTNPSPSTTKGSTTSDAQSVINTRANAERAASSIGRAIQNPGKIASDEQNTLPRHYQVVLEVDSQRINVKSPLAPRLGQLLQMQVINYQTLALLAASAKSEAIPASANASTAQVAADSPQTSIVHSRSQPPNQAVEILQQALRSSLPKQLPREALSHTYQQLLRPSAQPVLDNSPNKLSSTTPNANTPAANKLPNTTISSDTISKATISKATTAAPVTVKINTAPLADATATNKADSHTAITTNKPTQSNSPISATDKQLNVSALPATIKQTLNQLERALPQLKQLVSADGAKNALLNSGLFFETRLAQLAAQQGGSQTSATAANNTIQTSASKISLDPQNTIQTRSGSTLPSNAQANNADRVLSDDLKHQFGTLANAIKSTLRSQTQSSTSKPDTLAATQREILSNNAAIALLWQLDGAQINSRRTSADNDNNDAIMQLLRLALGQLARTQNHQLQAAGSQLATNNEASTTQTLTTELPFWHQGAVHILDIRVDQEQAARKANEKTQAWNLRLRFDLEELGELIAMATLQGKSMAAVFWASEKTLVNKLSGELEQLNNTLTELGIEVKQLHCQHGQPDSTDGHAPVNLLNTNLLQEKS